MSDTPELWTIARIASLLKVERHRVEYLIDARGIQPIGRAGNARVFGEGAVARITDELRRCEADRKGGTRDLL